MPQKKFPFEINPLDVVLDKKLKSYFQGEKDGYIEIGPKKYMHIAAYAKIAEDICNLELQPDDIWIVTFPRSGTTLTQEMAWLISNDFDYETAKKVKIDERSPFLEFCAIQGIPLVKNSTQKRIIKTHLPLSLLPPNLLNSGAKVIYIARNPKDTCVSLFHQNQLVKFVGFVGDLKTYWDIFENNLIQNAPYWDHLEEAWNNRNNPNMLFLFYEDIIEDLPKTIKKVGEFLGRNVTQEEVVRLADHLKFENFKNNPAVNYENWRDLGITTKDGECFIRKGKTGSWKEEFDKETNKRANIWIKCNLKRIGIKFPQDCQLEEL